MGDRAHMDLLSPGVPGFCSNQGYQVSFIGGCRSQSSQSSVARQSRLLRPSLSRNVCICAGQGLESGRCLLTPGTCSPDTNTALPRLRLSKRPTTRTCACVHMRSSTPSERRQSWPSKPVGLWPGLNHLHSFQCGRSPPSENHPEVTCANGQQSVPVWICCLMGSGLHKEPGFPGVSYRRDTLSCQPGSSLTRELKNLQLCFPWE